MTSVWHALHRGQSVRKRRMQLEHAHERFVTGLSSEPEVDLRERFAAEEALRPLVFESWLRSHNSTMNPDHLPEVPALSVDELQELRVIHPMSRVLPLVNRLLLNEATESGFIIAVGDAEGRLLWVDGDYRLRSRAEDMGFRAGMDWSERAVGMSAPGSALELDHAIQVVGAEHYDRGVHQWSCAAAPVHDPVTGSILGVIDVTGGDEIAAPHILPLVEATLAAVEAELKLESLRGHLERARPMSTHSASGVGRTGSSRRVTPRLVVLGRETALLECESGAHELSGRHAEILIALASSPKGMSAQVLVGAVYGEQGSEQTLRSEIARLRGWMNQQGIDLAVASRPYRLACEMKIDASEMLAALARGAHRLALASYEGPVLPQSVSPSVNELRMNVEGTLRESMLQSAAADQLFAYAQLWAPDDKEVWETLLRLLPPRSPKRARVVSALEELHTLNSDTAAFS